MPDRPEKPAYQQVSEHLQARILNGEFPVGSQLPSLAALMEQYAASATVVRNALRELRSAGIIATRQGKGAFVLAIPDGTAAESSGEFETIMRHLNQIRDQLQGVERRLSRVEQAVEAVEPAEGRTA